MKCAKAHKLIWRSADAEITPAESDQLREHLASCVDCRVLSGDASHTLDILDAWTAPEPKRDYISFTVAAEGRAPRAATVFGVRRWIAASLAAASVVCGVAVGLWTRPSQLPPKPSEQEVVRAIDLSTFGDVIEGSFAYSPSDATNVSGEKERRL